MFFVIAILSAQRKINEKQNGQNPNGLRERLHKQIYGAKP